MITRLLFLLFLLLGISCGKKLLEKPENLIPKEQMADILCDMALLNSINRSYSQVLVENDLRVMPFLFEKYGVDSLQFAQSDLYYASIPAEYQKIYDQVEARLARKRDSINQIIQKGKKPASDTLKIEEDYD